MAVVPDRRTERSREAILGAFRTMFFAHGYDAIDVGQVAAAANVGRSTFYKHFRSKEALLIRSLAPFLACLADACIRDDALPGVARVTEHFWENRRQAPAVFSGRSMTLATRALAEAIGERLGGMSSGMVLPASLVAAQVAAAQMALLDTWLRGRGACSSGTMASALVRSSRAMVAAATAG